MDDPTTRWNPLLHAACADGVCTAASLAVMGPTGLLIDHTVGTLDEGGPPAVASTPFDLASLTKVLATTSACLVLVDRGELDLDRAVGGWLPTAAWPDRTVRELLGHRAGLVPWQPWFEPTRNDPASAGLWPGQRGGTRRHVATARVRQGALATPAGSPGVRAYSDLGFMALGWVVEAVTGLPLDDAVRTLVTEPLGLSAPVYARLSRADSARVLTAAARTGRTRPRPFATRQEGTYAPAPAHPAGHGAGVDDDNAWALDGVAGHAGLFGTAAEVAAIGRAWLDDLGGAGRLARRDTVAHFLAVDRPDVLPVRSLGWDKPSPTGSTLGDRLGRGPRGAVGHLGFCGTSLWLDLDADVAVALLTNRTWAGRTDGAAIGRLRRQVHDAVADALGV